MQFSFPIVEDDEEIGWCVAFDLIEDIISSRIMSTALSKSSSDSVTSHPVMLLDEEEHPSALPARPLEQPRSDPPLVKPKQTDIFSLLKNAQRVPAPAAADASAEKEPVRASPIVRVAHVSNGQAVINQNYKAHHQRRCISADISQMPDESAPPSQEEFPPLGARVLALVATIVLRMTP